MLISIYFFFSLTYIISNYSLVMVYLSLWDGTATSFWGDLCSGYTTHSVMVVITVNPKIFGGIGGTEEVLPRVETPGGLQKKKLVSVGDLHSASPKSND